MHRDLKKEIKDVLIPKLYPLEIMRVQVLRKQFILKIAMIFSAWIYFYLNAITQEYFLQHPFKFSLALCLSGLYVFWPKLVHDLSKSNQLALNRPNVIGTIATFLLGFISLFIFSYDSVQAGFLVVGAFMINLMVYLLISEFFIVSIYKSKFKKEIIESLVKTINPEIAYTADGFVNESAFNASMHYGQSAHALYGGEDLFHGIHNNVSFHLSHVSLKSGRNNSESSIYFGPFIVIRLNHDFESAMLAKPKEKAIEALGSLMNINLGSLVNKSTYSGLDKYEGRHETVMPGYDIFCVDHVIVDKLASNHLFSRKLKKLYDSGLLFKFSIIDNRAYISFEEEKNEGVLSNSNHITKFRFKVRLRYSLNDYDFLFDCMRPYLELLSVVDLFDFHNANID